MSQVESSPLGASEVGRRVVRQTTAYALLRSASGVLTWGAFVALSRILDQRAFGAFEIGMFYIAIGQILGDGGLAASLVRRQGEVLDSEYRTAQTTVLAVAAVAALTLWLCAAWIGHANQLLPREVWALRALSPLYLVPALRLVPYVRLERSVNFAAIGRIELCANFARHLTAVLVASFGGGVWALALSQLALASTQVALSYRAAPGWVGLGWQARAFRSLFAYGSKIQASILLLHFKENLAAGLLGPTLGPSAVGVFRFALEFVRVPADIAGSLARVQFPVYAQHADGAPELKRVLRGTLRAVLLVGLPVLAAFALSAQWVVPLIYGNKWVSAQPVIVALVPHVAADLLILHLITFVQGRGRAGLALAIYGLWSGALWITGAVALALGHGSLELLAVAHGLSSALTLAVLLGWSGIHLRQSLTRELLPVAGAGLIGMAVAFTVRSLSGDVIWVRVVVSIVCFVAVYSACLLAFERRTVSSEIRAVIAMLRS